MSNIPKRNLASGCHLLKKIDQPSWRTTRRNYKHIPQIVYISSRFRALHLLSWEFERSEVLWRYTVINMYVITMAWRCISPWSFHRSLQRRREMDIFNVLGPCVIRPFIYHPQWPAWSLWRNWKFRAVLNCSFTAIMASNETFDLTRNGKVFKLRIATGDMTVSRLSRAWAVHYALLERELPQRNMLTKIKFLMQFRTH